MGFTTTRNNVTTENTIDITKLVSTAIKNDITAHRNKMEFILKLLRTVEDSFDDNYIVCVGTDNDINISEISVSDVYPKALYGCTCIHPSLMHRPTGHSVRLPGIDVEGGDAYWDRLAHRGSYMVADNLADALRQLTEHDHFRGLASFMSHCENGHDTLHKVQQETFFNPTVYREKMIDLCLIGAKTRVKTEDGSEVRD